MANASYSVLCLEDAIYLAPAVKSNWAVSNQNPVVFSLLPCRKQWKLFYKDDNSNLGFPRKGIPSSHTTVSQPSREREFSYLIVVVLDMSTDPLVFCPSRGGVWTGFVICFYLFFKIFIYFFAEGGREEERESNVDVRDKH